MEKLKGKVVCSLIGMFTGLSGIVSLSNCSAGSCSSCFRCAGVVLGIVLMALVARSKRVDRANQNRPYSMVEPRAERLSG